MTDRAMVQVPDDAPVMKAWNTYTATDNYANTRMWAAHDAHVDGSLWAAFLQGWTAALSAAPAPPPEPGVYGSEVLCPECAKTFCPTGERLHFHHDGCPACE